MQRSLPLIESRRDLKLASGLVVLLLLGVLGGVLYPRLSHWLAGDSIQGIALAADPACSPVGAACTAQAPSLAIDLWLGDTVLPLKAFPVAVRLSGADTVAVRRVLVRFTMPGMDMGINRFALDLQDNVWRGQAVLPVCTTAQRQWRVTVEVVGNPAYVGEFFLVAGR